jgi:hypothetical protein
MDSSSSGSSSAKKNKLDEDVRTYCDILARCGLSDVAKWKDEDLERAFRWSSYFRQVRKLCNVSVMFAALKLMYCKGPEGL